MAKLEKLGTLIETDVLVIGGGVSGLWAANRGRGFVDRITVVDKGPLDWGGLCGMSGGGMIAILPDEDIDEVVQELVYYYDGLCDQDMIREIVRQSIYRIKDYERLGCEFLKGPDGKLEGIPQRGLEHIKCYIGQPFGRDEKNMVEALIRESNRLGVERLGRILITDLLERDGAVVGAVGFHTRSGEFYIFKVGAVILATGTGGWKTSCGRNSCAGEGIDMASRAGTELSNFEFVRVWNVPKKFS